MSARLVAGVVSFSVAMTAVFLGNLFLWKMIEEINRQKAGDQVDYFWFTLPKILRIFEEYRSLCPNGRYAEYTRSCDHLHGGRDVHHRRVYRHYSLEVLNTRRNWRRKELGWHFRKSASESPRTHTASGNQRMAAYSHKWKSSDVPQRGC
jgi:hypothetical protein